MSTEADWVGEVHEFWFGAPESWFKPDPDFDAQIRGRFTDLYETLKQQGPSVLNARSSVAAVLVLDQFPRHMFRGAAREFATDSEALSIARSAIGDGADQRVLVHERMFLYMPFMHSEDPAAQQRSVALFTALDVPELARVAREHKLVIDKFGRFPHRNKVLGRPSTPDEIAFLKTGVAA
jgi:uncharacterized protein (DUF924 family)